MLDPIHQTDSHDQGPPHVVMMVANNVRADTRVRKMAESVASTGVQVTVIGLDLTGDGYDGTIGLAGLVVLRVGAQFRTARGLLKSGRTKAYWVSNQISERKVAFQLRQRDAAARIAWIREDARKNRQAVASRAALRKQRSLQRYRERRGKLKVTGSGKHIRPIRVARRALIRLTDLNYSMERRAQRLFTTVDRYFAEVRPRFLERLVRRRLSLDKARLDRRVRRLRRSLARGPSFVRLGLRRPGKGNWRRDLPEFDDYEAVVGPFLDRLNADVFHAHDVHLLGVAARATARARYRGRDTKLVYDAHEYVAGLARYNQRLIDAFLSVEREYIHRADRVITVSEPLADLLQADFKLAERPSVVMNIPIVERTDTPVPSLYGAAAVPVDAQIMVYSGGMDEARNVHTVVAALPLLPESIHLVLVAKARTGYVLSLFDLARELGVEHRLHVAPFVVPNDVVAYLSEATIGVHPMISSKLNHQIALPNKLFEYLHAGLPICVSDNRAMVEFVVDTGIGEWFEAEDPQSLADSVKKVLRNREKYVRARYDDPELLQRYSWDRQEEILVDLYRGLLNRPDLEASSQELPSIGNNHGVTLAIGPHNQAGQAQMWAEGLARSSPGVRASVFMVVRPHKLAFPATYPIQISEWWDPGWQWSHKQRLLREFTHVLFESGSSLLGGRKGKFFDSDLAEIAQAGIKAGLVFHGSDIRDPAIHRDLVAVSPFRLRDDLTTRLEVSTAAMLERLASTELSVFVSTKDLLDYVPDAAWLPQVVDMESWRSEALELGARPPVVVAVPTNERLKGAGFVDDICSRLAAEQLIEYRRYANVNPSRMPEIIASADIVVDGIVLGLYGTTSVEGMASGRLVIANIDRVVGKPGEPPPIVNADPTTFEETLLDIVQRPESYQELADRGPDYVSTFHDGRFAARQLATFLGVEIPDSLAVGRVVGSSAP